MLSLSHRLQFLSQSNETAPGSDPRWAFELIFKFCQVDTVLSGEVSVLKVPTSVLPGDFTAAKGYWYGKLEALNFPLFVFVFIVIVRLFALYLSP